MLSAVLAVGEVDFVSVDHSDKLDVVGGEWADNASHLLGIQSKDLLRCMTSLLNKTRGETVTINYSQHQAEGMSVTVLLHPSHLFLCRFSPISAFAEDI